MLAQTELYPLENLTRDDKNIFPWSIYGSGPETFTVGLSQGLPTLLHRSFGRSRGALLVAQTTHQQHHSCASLLRLTQKYHFWAFSMVFGTVCLPVVSSRSCCSTLFWHPILGMAILWIFPQINWLRNSKNVSHIVW